MRRFLAVLAVLSLLVIPVDAAETTKYVALTFDDGPSGRFTRRLLEELAQRRVLATFFLCGYRVEQYQELTAQIASDGHEIGCHGQTHESFRELSQMALCSELECSMERITTAAGQRPTLLRPPGGVFEPERLAQTVCADLPVVLWSVDPKDWRRSDADGIAAEVIEAVRPGDIILLHDMSDSSVDAALTIIDTLQARGVEFVTVSELARHAESLGVDAIAAIPPIYFHLPPYAIADYWNTISAAAPNTDFIIYNIPQLAGVALSTQLLQEMAKNLRVIGVKNSSMPTQDIQMWLDATERELVVFNGPDEQLISGLAIGATGGIGGTYAVMPELYLKIYECYHAGRMELAREIQNECCRIIYKMCSCHGNLYAVMKEILRREGMDVGTVRAPLPNLVASDMDVVSCAQQMIEAAVQKYVKA